MQITRNQERASSEEVEDGKPFFWTNVSYRAIFQWQCTKGHLGKKRMEKGLQNTSENKKRIGPTKRPIWLLLGANVYKSNPHVVFFSMDPIFGMFFSLHLYPYILYIYLLYIYISLPFLFFLVYQLVDDHMLEPCVPSLGSGGGPCARG